MEAENYESVVDEIMKCGYTLSGVKRALGKYRLYTCVVQHGGIEYNVFGNDFCAFFDSVDQAAKAGRARFGDLCYVQNDGRNEGSMRPALARLLSDYPPEPALDDCTAIVGAGHVLQKSVLNYAAKFCRADHVRWRGPIAFVSNNGRFAVLQHKQIYKNYI